MTIAELKKIYLPQLQKSLIPQPQKEIELIVSHFTGKTREFILSHPELIIEGDKLSVIIDSIKKRAKNCPLAYIFGEKEFFGLNFKVNPHTLIPRPETEQLVERAIQTLNENLSASWYVYEIGTGSGAISVALAKNLPTKTNLEKITASDISKKALLIAQKNASFHQVTQLIQFEQADLLDFLIKKATAIKPASRLLILANLPYVNEKIFANCPPDVRDYEPTMALVSGKDGLDHYRRLFKQIQTLQNIFSDNPIYVIIEHSPEQKFLLQTELIPHFFPKAKTNFHQDLAGKWRLTELSI